MLFGAQLPRQLSTQLSCSFYLADSCDTLLIFISDNEIKLYSYLDLTAVHSCQCPKYHTNTGIYIELLYYTHYTNIVGGDP